MARYCFKQEPQLFGVPLEKFIGAPLQSFLSGNDAEFLKTLIIGAKLASTRGEIRLNRKNGSRGRSG